MKDIILVTENWKGTETNMLMSFVDYIKNIVLETNKDKMELALQTMELERTKDKSDIWVEDYLAANKSYSARYCGSETQLRYFLQGVYNDKNAEVRFDESRCSEDCLSILQDLGLDIQGNLFTGIDEMHERRMYDVEIQETLCKILSVEADSMEDALEKAEEMYSSEEIVLGYGEFIDIDFMPSQDEKLKMKRNLRSR